MINELNNLAKSIGKTVIKIGNKYYVCNETGYIRHFECSNSKCVINTITGIINAGTFLYGIDELEKTE